MMTTLWLTLLSVIIVSIVAWRWGFIRPLSATFHPRVTASQLISVAGIYGGYLVVLPLIVQQISWLNGLGPVAWSWVSWIISCSLLITLLVYLKTEGKGIVAMPDVLHNSLWGLVTLVIALPCVSLVEELCNLMLYAVLDFHGYEQMAVRYLRNSLGSLLQTVLAMTSIIGLAPVAEELVFRGVVQQYFKRLFSTPTAIVVTSLLFATCHFSISQGLGNLSLIPSLALFACFLGYLYERQQSLMAPIALHAAFNAVNVLHIVTNLGSIGL